ncbi:Efflux pump azaL [Mycena sanguinolenta]|uniref:Efflux pump azaL n=1 Tax=Mycena sanguinolenta TaxID=230812 RepID=A0A8H6YY40_9AGAR|nr:Efflux pump azaL [Mycena sanguinolenta]
MTAISSLPPSLPATSLLDMDEDITETTVLIPKPQQKTPTPLPKLQFGIIMFVLICEPTAGQSIYPYINQLVSELGITGGDQRKVGYYAESLFYFTEATTTLQWSRASDYVGRKPILVIGLFGTTLSMLCFGMSRTFWMLVASRCLTGLLNGNVGVMKSTLADLTDSSNRAQAVGFLPIMWELGSAFGFFIGGYLSQPQRRFPNMFSGKFWEDYPYLLPSLATGSLVCFSGVIILLFFKETAPSKKSRTSDEREDSNSHAPSPSPAAPVHLLQLLTFPVMISVSNYISLAFLNIVVVSLIPLFFAMPVTIGGLGLPPSKIGLVMTIQSVAVGVFQLFFFAKIIRRFGERAVMIGGMSMFPVVFGLIPIISATAQQSGRSVAVWALVACLLSLNIFADMCFGVVWMFLAASAPKDRRGAVNGLGQTSVSLARAIAPAFATSFFSLSVEYNLLGGYAVYAFFGALSVGAVMLARRLPGELWEEEDH